MTLNFKRINLGHFPTPIQFMKNITTHLNGPKIYIKRDDCTGLATGGNKTRKLEYLMPEAIKNKASLIVTIGDQLENGSWTFALKINYFIKWIWFSASLMVMGMLITIFKKKAI